MLPIPAQRSGDRVIAVPACHEQAMIRLFEAIEMGASVLINVVLPNIEDHWGLGHDLDTVLIHAAAEGDLEVVDRVLARGANPHLKNRAGQTALWCAADRGQLDVVNRLIQRVPSTWSDAKQGHTPFMRAIINGHAQVVRAMLPVIDVNQACVDGVTPLMLAVLNQREALVDPLVNAGASLDARTHDGETVMDLARASECSADVIARLHVYQERPVLMHVANDLGDGAIDLPSALPRSRL